MLAPRRRRSGFLALILISSCALVAVAQGDAPPSTLPNLAGTWNLTEEWDNVPSTSPYHTQDETYTFTQTAPGVYSISNGLGWTTTDVQAANGSFTLWQCGAGGTYSQADEGACPITSGYWLMPWTITVSQDGQLTATGSFQAYNGNGSPNYYYGTFTGVGPQTPVASSTLDLSIAPRVPAGGLGVGSSLTVPVTVTAEGDAVNDVSLSGLSLVGGSAVKVTQSPPGTSGFSLTSGASRTFNYTVVGVAAGKAKLSVSASGTGADGSAVTASAAKAFPVVQPSLKITMVADPGTVSLEANDDGALAPKDIKVQVRIANASKAAVKSVKLIGLDPVPEDPTQQLDKLAFARGSLPINFGTIQPRASLLKTLTLRVTGDGTYVIKALALYDNPASAGGNGRTYAEGGRFTVTAPLLYFTAKKDVASVDAGGSWYVTGHVKNLSSFQTLCLSPLQPQWKDNAGGLGPHQIGVVPVDDPAPPLAGALAPGQTISFLMRAQTEVGGVQTSAVVLDPQATKGVPGDSCSVLSIAERPALSAKEIKLASGSTSFRVSVAPVAKAAGSGALEFFGGYAQGSAASIEQVYQSGVSLVKQYGTPAKLISALGSGASTVLSRLYHAAAFSAWFWYEATPAEQLAFEQQVASDFVSGVGKAWNGVQTAVEQAVGRYMKLVETAYMTGDTSALFNALGQSSANVVNEQAVTIGAWELGLGVLKRAGVVGETMVRATAKADSAVLTSLKTVPAGRLLKFSEMQRLWGLAYEDYVAFRKIAEEEGVLIGVRGRSPQSVRNLEDGAVWKHENLKPKNVNSIDVDYLGFDKADRGLVAFRTYTEAEETAIRDRIAAIKDPAVRDAVLDRMATRFGEKQYLGSIEHFNKIGEIDVGFNYADNGLIETSTQVNRGFALEATPIEGGGTYYRPYQENPALDGLADSTGKLPKDASLCIRKMIDAIKKLLCRVTGDMDGVYLTNTDGTALSAAKRIKVYDLLAAVGWQHPETLTWIKKGLFNFDSKSKILKGLELGGEAMMEFSPDGVRATYLSLDQSKLVTVSNYFVAVLGGYTELKTALPGT